MVSEEEVKAVAFNMNMQFLQHLAELLREADYFLKGGMLIKCYDTLLTIKLNIIQSLTDEERKEFEALERSMENSVLVERARLRCEEIDYPSLYIRNLIKRETINHSLKERVIKYRIKLQDVMDKKGYLVKKADDLKRAF